MYILPRMVIQQLYIHCQEIYLHNNIRIAVTSCTFSLYLYTSLPTSVKELQFFHQLSVTEHQMDFALREGTCMSKMNPSSVTDKEKTNMTCKNAYLLIKSIH